MRNFLNVIGLIFLTLFVTIPYVAFCYVRLLLTGKTFPR